VKRKVWNDIITEYSPPADLSTVIEKPTDFGVENPSTYLDFNSIPRVITETLRLGRNETYSKYFTINTPENIPSFTVKSLKLFKSMDYTYADPYDVALPARMNTSQYTFTDLYTAESGSTDDDITVDLDHSTIPYKFNKPTSPQMIGDTTSLFEIRFIRDGDITTDMAGTVKVIEIDYEPSAPFPQHVMITNISASGNRGLFYFDLFVSGGSQLNSLPSVVCDDFSATRYWGIKTGMIEEHDPRLNAAEALESRLAAAEYGFSTAYDVPLFNLTDLGDNIYMNETVNAYASTGDGDADLSNGCDLVSQHFEI